MLNEIDKKILAILLRDARATHAQMAEEVGLSRPAIAERIKKLEQAGVIRGFSVILDPDTVGQSMTAFISAKIADILDESVQKALLDLKAREEIIEIDSVAGDDCFLIKVRANDMSELNRIVNSLKEPPFRMSTKTTIVLERYFEKIGGVTLE